jgi:hypothetical protein
MPHNVAKKADLLLPEETLLSFDTEVILLQHLKHCLQVPDIFLHVVALDHDIIQVDYHELV